MLQESVGRPDLTPTIPGINSVCHERTDIAHIHSYVRMRHGRKNGYKGNRDTIVAVYSTP